MLPRSLRVSLMAVQLTTVVMLMRSVALDRWITVAASLLLLAASAAAVRGRTWGVALSYLLGVTFVSLCFLGIAPPFFAVLGVLAIRPFARVFRHMVGFDRGAAASLAAGAAAIGGAAGLAWKAFAQSLFATFPSLIPSIHPQHGLLVAAIGAVGGAAVLAQHRSAKSEARAEIAETTERAEMDVRVRVRTDAQHEADEDDYELLRASDDAGPPLTALHASDVVKR